MALTARDLLKKIKRNTLDKTDLDERLVRSLTRTPARMARYVPGVAGIAAANTLVNKARPVVSSPQFKSGLQQANKYNLFANMGDALTRPVQNLPDNNAFRKVAYGLAGASELPSMVLGMGGQRNQQYLRNMSPSDNAARRVGSFAYKTAAFAPLGGAKTVGQLALQTGRNVAMGAGLGGAFTTGGALLQRRLPTGQELVSGMAQGAENSAVYPVINRATDLGIRATGQALNAIAPRVGSKVLSLTDDAIGASARGVKASRLAKYKTLPKHVVKSITREVLETPGESVYFSALDALNPEETRKYPEILKERFVGDLLGNVMFGAARGVGGTIKLPTKTEARAIAQKTNLSIEKVNAAIDQQVMRAAKELSKTTGEKTFRLRFSSDGQQVDMVMPKVDASDWTAYLQYKGIEYKLDDLGTQGGFVQGKVSKPPTTGDIQVKSQVKQGLPLLAKFDQLMSKGQTDEGLKVARQILDDPKYKDYHNSIGSVTKLSPTDPTEALKVEAPDPTAALKAEALKYKSAEEFVKAQGITKDYVAEVKPTKLGTSGSSPFKLASEARRKSADITQREIEIAGRDQKIFDANKNKSIAQLEKEIAEHKRFADEVGGSYPREIQVKQDIINSKSQLTDLYNQAKGATTAPKVDPTEALKAEAKTRFKIDVDNVGKANNQIDQWIRYLNDKPDEALKAAGYSTKGGGNADYVSQGLINLKQQLNQPTPPATAPKVDRTLLTGKQLDTPNAVLSNQAQFQTPKTVKPKAPQVTQSSLKSEPPNQSSEKISFVATPKDKSQVPFYDKELSKQAAAGAYLEESEGKKVFDQIFARFIGKRDSAKTKAFIRSSNLPNVDRNTAEQVIKYLDGDLQKPSKKVIDASQPFRQEYDKLYKEAQEAGINLRYLENYVPHFWKESPQEVAQKFMSARGKFPNAKERTYPTYSEGIRMGLTPRYTHPTQLLNAYVRGLEKAKANIEFMTELRNNGVIVNESVARSNPGFTPIFAQGFGKNESMLGNETILVGNWYAPESIAKQINQVFSPPDKTKLSTLAKLSGGFQDIYLSGGVPGTPLNAFTFGQVIKDVAAGRVTSPFVSIARSLSPQKSADYFKQKAPIINMMQEDNIPVRSNLSIDRFIDADSASKTFGEKVGSAWSKLVNEPTFARFMPMQTIDLYEKTLSSAVKSGKSEAEARQIATEVTKRFYGITSSDVMAKRSQITKDLATSFLFAPRYRESMLSFWVNNVKSLKNPLAKENAMNVRFIIGATVMFAAYNALNREFTGNNIWENDRYKKDKLLIPLNDGTTLGIPFLPSVAYLPRTMLETGEAVARGELDKALGTAMGFISSLVRPVADVVRNKTYFGGPVYPYDGTPGEKYGAIGGYLAKQYTAHPYVREGIDMVAEKMSDDGETTPAYQRISRAMELPLRFYGETTTQEPTKLARVADKNVRTTFETTDDQPQNMVQKVSLAARGLTKDPKNVLKAIFTKEELRKIENDAVILKRPQFLNKSNDPNLELDHLIPLGLGGDNSEGNLRYVSKAYHKKKTANDQRLIRQLQAGEITRKEAQKQVKEFIKNNPTKYYVVEDPIDNDVVEKKLKDKPETLSADEIATYYLAKVEQPKKMSKYAQALYEKDVWDQVSSINSREKLTDQQKDEASLKLLESIGVSKDDYEYYQVAKESTELNTMYVLEAMQDMDRQEMIDFLSAGRKEVRGERLVNDTVLDNLYNDNVVTYDERKYLKSLKWNGTKVDTKQSTSRAKKVKLGATPKMSKVTVSRRKVSAPKVSFTRRKSPILELPSAPKSKKVDMMRMSDTLTNKARSSRL